ncbi:uncharacterized protein [Hyperolius riggenbachi]
MMERGEDPCVDAAPPSEGAAEVSRRAGHRGVGSGWNARKRGSLRPAGRAVSRRSLRLVRRLSKQEEEEGGQSSSPPTVNCPIASASPSHNGVTQQGDSQRGGRIAGPEDASEADKAADGAEKPHTCPRCGETCAQLMEFLSHQMGGCQARPHRCNICSKSFVKKQHLSAHRKTHTEDRPYTCNQCGRSFRQNSTLTTHLWSHAGHKPFHCTCCPKRFSRKTDLLAHLRRHTGERPYQCPYCPDRFIRKKSLQRHLQKHSGESLTDGWDINYPQWRASAGRPPRLPKIEESVPETSPTPPPLPEPAVEFDFRWPDVQEEERPLVETEEHAAVLPIQAVKTEEEEEEPELKPALQVPARSDQSTQTQNTRPGRVQQQMLRELRRCRRSAAHAQQERDCMRAALDHLTEEMKQLKEMVATLCAGAASGVCPPPPQPNAILVQNSCPVWSPASEEQHYAESDRASPESSLQCMYRSPLDAASDQSRDHVSWMYRNSPHEEDDMIPTTTIKREEEEEELEESPSPELPFYRYPQYVSLQTGERLPNIAMVPLSVDREWTLLARCAGKPGRFAALVFRALVPFEIYKTWVNRVNLDGLRGRKGIPLNVKQRVMMIVERHFNLRKCDHSEIRNRLNEQLRTRRKSDNHPPSLL